MRVLVAPDKFKDALGARAVTRAIAAGIRDARPEATILECPLGDGGEGTGELLAVVSQAKRRVADVLDPLGRMRAARWWFDAAARRAFVEMAEASGLGLLAPAERAALRTTSYGTGQLLRAARNAGATHIVLCVGGSATVDGGAGCLQALGWRLRDRHGHLLPEPITGGQLREISQLEFPDDNAAPAIDVLCDVDNPLLGARGAAAVFAPQKGADAAGVQTLAEGLENWADVLRRFTGCQVASLPGGGAAGGLPAGLAAAFGARLRHGFDEVARQLKLPENLAGCDLCLTGEGRIDAQTAGGKVVAGVAKLSRSAGVPVVALTGDLQLMSGQSAGDFARALGVTRIVVVTPTGTALSAALATTRENLRRAAAEICAAWDDRA